LERRRTFDPAFYNSATAVNVNPATGNPVAGSGDSLDGTGLFGNGFPASTSAHVLSSVYHIPFHSGSRFANEELGGWQLSQAYQFQTGTPLNVLTGQDIAGVGAGFQGQFL
jgi:hypothetical protein